MSSRIIPNFPTPQERESFHYILVRYFDQTHGLRYEEKCDLLHATLPPLNQIPANLFEICQRLGNSLTPEEIILEHSTFPFVHVFLTKEQQEMYLDRYTGNNGSVKLAFWKSFTQIESYRYCPECIKNQEGLIYPRVEWLLKGINICPVHGCYLKEYPVPKNSRKTSTFLIDPEKLDYQASYCTDEDVLNIANLAIKLFDYPFFSHNQREITQKFDIALKEKGLKDGLKLNIERFYRELYDFYSDSIRDLIEEDYIKSKDNPRNSDLMNVLRKHNYGIKPVYWLILINFLYGDLNELFNKSPEGSKYYFDENLSLKALKYQICQNPVCPDYYTRKNTIVTNTGKVEGRRGGKREIVRCLRCGAVHLYINEKFIKFFQRGPLWFDKLNYLVAEGVSQSEIARILKIFPGCVEKFLNKSDYTPFDSKIKKYRNKLKGLFWVRPKDLKEYIRENLKTELHYLKYNDSIWLENYFKKRLK